MVNPLISDAHLLPQESDVTEIEVTPDGRVYLFGSSLRVMQLLSEAGLGDASLQKRLSASEKTETSTMSDECHDQRQVSTGHPHA